MQERSGVSVRYIFAALAVGLALSLGFALFVHERFIRYEPRAGAHLTRGDSVVVAVFRVEQAVAYEPFRKHLLSLLEVGNRRKETRLVQFERATGIELGVDAREVGVSFGADGTRTVVVGGLFRRDGFAAGMERFLADFAAKLDPTKPDYLVLGSGVTVGMADDGAILVSSTEPRYFAARKAESVAPPKPGVVLEVRGGPALSSLAGAALEGFWLEILPASEGSGFVCRGEVRGGPEAREAALRLSPVVMNSLDWKGSAGNVHGFSGMLTRGQFDEVVARLGVQTARGFNLE